MRIMFIGDIFSKSGRLAVIENIKKIKKTKQIDLIIANVENASHCRCINEFNYNELVTAGIDLMTLGNHTWDSKQLYNVLNHNNIIRPLNIQNETIESNYGVGSNIFTYKNIKIRVTNLLSLNCRTKNAKLTNPFCCFQNFLKNIGISNNIIHIVDFHAETTSEKKAFLLSFCGKVSMIVGTHTHVQTNDAQIYNNTAFITDVGMCGAKHSIIGAKPKQIIQVFFGEKSKFRLEPAIGLYQFNSIIVDFDNKTLKPLKISYYNF